MSHHSDLYLRMLETAPWDTGDTPENRRDAVAQGRLARLKPQRKVEWHFYPVKPETKCVWCNACGFRALWARGPYQPLFCRVCRDAADAADAAQD